MTEKYKQTKAIFLILCLLLLILFLILYSVNNETQIIKRIIKYSKVNNFLIDPSSLAGGYSLQTQEKDLDLGASFSFMHMGHTRGDLYLREKNLDHIQDLINKVEPDFILHSGDLIQDAYDLNDWKTQFFELFKDVKVPIYISPSNHEASDNYQNYRLFLRDELWYSFDVGEYHFIVLAYMETSGEQINWFVEELGNNDKIIVLLGGQKNNVFQDIIEQLQPPTVKLVLAGDGVKSYDSRIGNIPYLVSNEFLITVVNINNNTISWKNYYAPAYFK
ncbi:metallophosphoesterase [Candidatus Woesearchaeota archaeon]|nr:metallophosphoesterase [Candidatus Woesearchaeota archaeon]